MEVRYRQAFLRDLKNLKKEKVYAKLHEIALFERRYDDTLAAHHEAREIFERLGEPGDKSPGYLYLVPGGTARKTQSAVWFGLSSPGGTRYR